MTATTDTMYDARVNAEQANALVAGALQETPDSAPAQASIPPIQPPADTSVTLLAGVVDQLNAKLANDAEVRELNGLDEEALTKPALRRSPAKYLGEMVKRGTVDIGGRRPDAQTLDSLLIGDRELLLLGIRKATYGHDIELTTRCPHCQAVDPDYVFDLRNVEVKPLESDEDAIFGFDVELPSGKTAKVGLATAADQDAILGVDINMGIGEINTLMLQRTVRQIDDNPVFGPRAVQELGLRDRNAILEALEKRTPGPQLGEAKRTCGACEQEFELGLGLLDIFRT